MGDQKKMKNVLIVDDSATMRRMVKVSLRSLKEINFDEAGNGLEALERLALTPVDLMILDLNMPDMHGIEVLKFVRGHRTFHSVPVIVLTTRSDEENRKTTLEAGASSYMTKPFEPNKLLEQVQEFI
jgi:two-component system, chemotaxis family, chemotaxis protein CheY